MVSSQTKSHAIVVRWNDAPIGHFLAHYDNKLSFEYTIDIRYKHGLGCKRLQKTTLTILFTAPAPPPSLDSSRFCTKKTSRWQMGLQVSQKMGLQISQKISADMLNFVRMVKDQTYFTKNCSNPICLSITQDFPLKRKTQKGFFHF